jgi:hypothetical protein
MGQNGDEIRACVGTRSGRCCITGAGDLGALLMPGVSWLGQFWRGWSPREKISDSWRNAWSWESPAVLKGEAGA